MPRRKKREYGQGSIYKRSSDGKWVGKYRDVDKNGKRCYKAVYGSSYDEVESKLKKRTHEVETKKPGSKDWLLLEEYLDLFLDARKRKLKPKSYDRLEQSVRLYVKPALGKIKVGELTSEDVDRMINNMQDSGLSRSTIKKAKEVVTGAYRWGIQSTPQKVTFVPGLGSELPSEDVVPTAQIRVYSLDEAKALIRAAYATWSNGTRIYRLGGVVELLINTGLRLAELVSLEWGRDIDFKREMLSVSVTTVHVRDYSPDASSRYHYIEGRPKSKAGVRSIPLTKAAVHALRDLWEYTGNTRYVVATEEGTPARERAIDRMIEAIGRRAGLPEDRLPSAHPLRHTFATLFLYGHGKGQRGNIKLLSMYMGHSSVQITYDTYVHVTQAMQAEDIGRFPSINDQESAEVKRVPSEETKAQQDDKDTPSYLQIAAHGVQNLLNVFPDTLDDAYSEAERRKDESFLAAMAFAQYEHTDEEANEFMQRHIATVRNYNLQSYYVHEAREAKKMLGAAYSEKDCIDTINAMVAYRTWPKEPYVQNPIYETYLPVMLGERPICFLPIDERAARAIELYRLFVGDVDVHELMTEAEIAEERERAEKAAAYYKDHPYSDDDPNWVDYQE